MLKDRAKTDTLIIHCSHTKPSQDLDIKDLDKKHRQKGYQYGVGYHYFIKRDGTLQEGRPLMKIGAHCLGWDGRSIGVCLAGGLSEKKDYPENNFTPEQFNSLALLVDLMKGEFPGLRVIGHGDLISGHDCPNFDVTMFV